MTSSTTSVMTQTTWTSTTTTYTRWSRWYTLHTQFILGTTLRHVYDTEDDFSNDSDNLDVDNDDKLKVVGDVHVPGQFHLGETHVPCNEGIQVDMDAVDDIRKKEQVSNIQLTVGCT